MLEAEHTCMTMRGIKKTRQQTITTVTRGAFTEDKELQKNVPFYGKRMNNNFQIWIVSIGSGGTRFIRNIIKKYRKLESERIFCRHTPEHFLDVARLMYIYALEEHLELPKELIYAAALLHDIGRAQQYQYNIPHDIAGVEIARGKFLTDLHFTEQEKRN